ncbi:MAG TPA: PAS domain-containing protein, partial [Burkholderiales bacterium]|nr:PAS domain-containing protein [Burkholderiales bacterium]
IPILHYALKPTGFLWLGSSETIGAYRDLFEITETRHKIYRKKPTATRLPLAVAGAPERPAGSPAQTGVTGSGHEPSSLHVDAYREADRLLIAKYAPPGVLVNGDFEILQFRGDTGLYLTPAPGKASFNLLTMLREGLLVGVRAALYKAKKEEREVREEGLRVRANGGYREVSIEVVPIRTAVPRASCFMVLFDERAATNAHAGDAVAAVPSASDTDRQDDEATRVQQELAATREYLQSVIEQQDAANEELQAANEEVQSSNEELQSVNEELETSKEEVQSSNEELVTVNEELHNRNVELVRTNNDLLNLLSSVEVAIIILDPGLRIRRCTPMAGKMLNVIPADVGRPLKDVNLNIDMPDLVQHLENVIDTVSAKEFEVRDSAGHWYLLRLRPYRTIENQIDGALLVLVDVDPVKRGEETLRRQTKLLEQLHEPIFMWDLDDGIFYWNKASSETYGYAWEEARGRSSHELLATSPPFSTFRAALMANGRWSAEVLHTRRDGQKIMVESRMALVREAA